MGRFGARPVVHSVAVMNDRPTWQPPARERGWPRWLKLLLIAIAVVILVAVAVMLLGGGHTPNPSRHFLPHGAAVLESAAKG